jgi:hypothetical protein
LDYKTEYKKSNLRADPITPDRLLSIVMRQQDLAGKPVQFPSKNTHTRGKSPTAKDFTRKYCNNQHNVATVDEFLVSQ